MGRFKPRTNKRPPPKTRLAPAHTSPPPLSPPAPPLPLPLAAPFPPIDFSNPSEETIARLEKASQSAAELSAALSSLTEDDLKELRKLHKRNPLPTLTEAQMSAITSAAARVGGAGLLGPPPFSPTTPSLNQLTRPQSQPQANGTANPDVNGKSNGTTLKTPAGEVNMADVQASLAALFQAKLTLDREKERLLKMQEELEVQKGQKEMQVRELEMRERERRSQEAMGAVRMGMEMGIGDQRFILEEDCTCGQCHVYEPDPENECYDCDDECGCDCHSHDECDEVMLDRGDYDHGDSDMDDHDVDYDEDLHDYPVIRQPLSEDPERLDKTVKELFNWIKTVVWTIEQAAVVSGRQNWSSQETLSDSPTH